MTDHATHDNNSPEEKSVQNIFRIRKTSHFVTISILPLNDPNISLKAKGLWAFGMGHPNNWTFHISELQKHCKEGARALYGAFNELIEGGYAARFSYQERIPGTNKWRFSGNEYIFFESKQTPEEVLSIKEEFKKSFPHRRFAHAQVADAQNSTLIRYDSLVEHDSLERNAPAVADAAPPPSSKKKTEFIAEELKERVPDNPATPRFKATFKTALVGTSDTHHQQLVAKYGEATTQKLYDHLAEWKLSKAEVSPREVNKHADYYRITKWVAKDLLEQDLLGGSPRSQKSVELYTPSSTEFVRNKRICEDWEGLAQPFFGMKTSFSAGGARASLCMNGTETIYLYACIEPDEMKKTLENDLGVAFGPRFIEALEKKKKQVLSI